MKVLGLTGGIGMGESTAAAAFRRAHLFPCSTQMPPYIECRREAGVPCGRLTQPSLAQSEMGRLIVPRCGRLFLAGRMP